MPTTKVNYKSDLPPIQVQLALGGEVQQIPTHDFVLRFFTVYPHRHYDCTFEGGVWTNMEKVDDTHLKVYITNHALGVGFLNCVYISKAPHEGYERDYYTTYSLSGLNVELVEGNGSATDGIDAQIAIDIDGVITECRAATAAALEMTELMEPIYNRLKDIFPDNYYTKTESENKFHPLYGNRSTNLNADNLYVNRVYMLNADDGDDAFLTNHTSSGKNKITIGNGSKVTVLPWPTSNETWTLATTKDLEFATGVDVSDYYKKGEVNSLLYNKQNTLVSGSNIKTVGGEDLLGFGNVGTQYVFDVTISGDTVSCEETYESLTDEINGNDRPIFAKVGSYIYHLEGISGLNIVFRNLDGGKTRELICRSYEEPEWVYSEKDMDAIPIKVTVTESSGTYSADKTFAQVDAALTAGKQVQFVDGTSIYDVTSYEAETSVVATCVSGTTSNKFTYTSSGLTKTTTSLQEALVSGTNIKTVNNTSLLGNGDLSIVGKSAYQSYVDTTSDSPVKTETEWVASLKGEDGVDLGEVAIADNLTTNDATKVLSAKQGYALKGLIDGKQSTLTFDNVPTAAVTTYAASNNPVKSGGIAEAFESAAVLTGAGNTVVRARLRGQFEVGRKYRITLSNPSISMTGVTGDNNDRFCILARLSGNTGSYLVRRYVYQTGNLASFYDVIIPSNTVYLYVTMRAATGETMKLWVRDVTDIERIDTLESTIGNKGLGEHNVLLERYLNSSGVSTEMAGYMHTDYIPCANESTVVWKTGASDSNLRLTCYDSDKAKIGDNYITSSGSNSITISRSGCTYVRAAFSRRYAEVSSLSINGDIVWSWRPRVDIPGADNTQVGRLYYGVEGGRKYKLHISNPNIAISNVTDNSGYQRFVIGALNSSGTNTLLVTIMCNNRSALADYYEIALPKDTINLGIWNRANTGQTLHTTLEKLDAEEEEESTDIVSCGDWVTLTNGNINLSSEIVDSTKHVYTSPIEGGRGFHLAVNDGYRVYSAHLCDRKGNVIGVNYLPAKLKNNQHRCIWDDSIKADWHSRLDFGSDLIMPQHTIRLVICKADTESDPSKVIDASEPIIKRFTYLDNPRLHRIEAQNISQANQLAARTRMRLLTNTVFSPLISMTASGGAADGYTTGPFDNYFHAGRVRNGIPYSENDIYSKYVGQHVSLYTFMTAMLNKRSVMYTEQVASYPIACKSAYGIVYSKTLQDGNTNLKWGNISGLSANYYGQVCSGFTGYIANLPDVYTSAAYKDASTIGGYSLTTIESPTIENVEPLDFIWNEGHISIIADIIADERGKRKFVVLAEQSKPSAFITPLTAERFTDRLNGVSAKVRRWSGWSSVTMPDVPSWLQMDYMDWPREIECEADIMTIYGDKPCLEVDDVLHLNLRRGDGTNTLYDTLEIFEESADPSTDAAISTVDISSTTTYPSHTPDSNRYVYASQSYPAIDDGEDWVDYTVTGLSYGKYKARLKNTTSSTYSGWTRWELISIGLTALSVGDAEISVQGGKSGATWILRSESNTGLTNNPTFLEYGTTTASFASGKVLKLLVPGDYGVACKIIDISAL